VSESQSTNAAWRAEQTDGRAAARKQADANHARPLIDLAFQRGRIVDGQAMIIAGVIVQFHNKQVIVRALGPTLTGFSVPNALADPTLEIRDVNGTLLASNDDWKDNQQNDIVATGKAPPNDLESAIVGTLFPGNYTAIVRGFNNTTGNALVEVYALN